jgi:hypothetical protein
MFARLASVLPDSKKAYLTRESEPIVWIRAVLLSIISMNVDIFPFIYLDAAGIPLLDTLSDVVSRSNN